MGANDAVYGAIILYLEEYYDLSCVIIGGAIIGLATSLSAFWSRSGQSYREHNSVMNAGDEGRLSQTLKSRATRVASIFLFCYVGAGGALGGWIVTFMRRERAGGEFESGVIATGFWTGIAAGRLILSFITPKLGEKLAVLMYIIIAVLCQHMFWLVPSFHVSSVFVALQGFFLGPLFPAVIAATTKALPLYLQVSAIGFSAAIAVGGDAALPFAIGSQAHAKGLGVLQPIITTALAMLLVLWLCFPRQGKRRMEGVISLLRPEELGKRWLIVDFDLIETGRHAIAKARGYYMGSITTNIS
ncbi:hypothetical protein G6011_389 [Alternaria panax]|uniref:MFS general substrate transporter n=1 Tax=Alternaria panax TaxID=48097 RepID=A0AAD4IIR5_9PLEO|nr:hypothetical protein G6011_389 [Alternaria panax]